MDVVLQKFLREGDIQTKKWNNQMTHGMCLCVFCMCIVMREERCEKSNEVCHAVDAMVGGDTECDAVDCGHSIEHPQTR